MIKITTTIIYFITVLILLTQYDKYVIRKKPVTYSNIIYSIISSIIYYLLVD